jgi:predicted ATPase
MLRKPRRHTAWRHVTAAGVGGWSRTCERTSHDIRFLALLAEALAHVDTTGERSCAVEVYRLKGELLLRQVIPDAAQAETCLHQALDIARHQEATSWELRVVLSLSRLWQRQGKHAEAHQLLAESYGWFTEEFDAVDLQEAQALLEELA